MFTYKTDEDYLGHYFALYMDGRLFYVTSATFETKIEAECAGFNKILHRVSLVPDIGVPTIFF